MIGTQMTLTPVRVAVLSALLLLATVWSLPQGLYSDPGWQLKAVSQYVAGESSTPNSMTMADRGDLHKNVDGWISVWTPGVPLLSWPLLAAGLAPGQVARLLAAFFILLGACGWARWVCGFGLPPWLEWSIAAALPWHHIASNAVFQFSSEVLVFGIMPWVLLAATRAARSLDSDESGPSLSAALLFGLLGGSAYVLKDSSGLPVSVAMLWLAHRALANWRRTSGTDRWRRLAFVAVAAVACASFVAASSVANMMMGTQANVVVELFSAGLRPAAVLRALGAPALMLADADAMLRFIALHPSRAWLSENTLLLCASPFGLGVVWLLWRARRRTDAAQLALWVVAGSVLELAAIWNLSASISAEARHAATAGLCALPAVIEAARSRWPTLTRPVALLVAAVGVALVALPVSYGIAAVFTKRLTRPNTVTGAAGVANPLLGADIPACITQLTNDFDPARDVWYVTDPVTALDLPGRVRVEHADFLAIDALTPHYGTSRPVRLRALLPTHFETNGKGPAIRQALSPKGVWTTRSTPGCLPQLWMSDKLR